MCNTQIIKIQNSCFRFDFRLNQCLFERHTRRKCHFKNIISDLSTIVPNSVSNSFVNYYESQKIPSCLDTTKSQIKMDFLLVFVQFKYKKRGRRKKRKVNFLRGKQTHIHHPYIELIIGMIIRAFSCYLNFDYFFYYLS